MKCQNCHESEATVHWTDIVGNQKQEKHLCEECARGQDAPLQQPVTLSKFLQQLLQQKVEQEFSKGVKESCPVCGMSYIEFRSSGRLGCPNDYEVFKEGLLPMLERLQDDVRHSGKVPSCAPKDLRKHNDMIRLRRQLERAVQREEYEKAAALRDQIERLAQETPDGE